MLDDAAEIAELFAATRAASLPYLPVLHSADEDFQYFSGVLASCEVWVAESGGDIVGFCAFRDGWVDHLYVSPASARNGIGNALLDRAKSANTQIKLWAFQRNNAARDFYRALGFREIQMTDGAENEEREPDVLLEWRRPVK
jgi:ribosomal protein S18 acetylase RimI-like enzyme